MDVLGSEIQSIIFDLKKYDTMQARKWMRERGIIPIKKVHISDHSLRYRIRPKEKFKNFVSKKLTNDITLILGY